MGSGQLFPPVPRGLHSHRGTVRLRMATALAAAAAAALLAAIIWTSVPEPAEPGSTSGLVHVGVVEGQSVPAYLDASRAELRELQTTAGAGPTWALVSLTGYLPPGLLPAVLDGTTVAQVYARAQQAGSRAPVVRIPAYRLPEDVVTGMLGTAFGRERERADYAGLSAGLSGSAVDERVRRAYEQAAVVAQEESVAYRSLCACVFAAVVRAAPTELVRVAGRAGVRVVDPAPEVTALADAEFRPPLPEQVGSVPVEARVVAPRSSPALPSSLGPVVTSASPRDFGKGSGPAPAVSRESPAVPSGPAP